MGAKAPKVAIFIQAGAKALEVGKMSPEIGVMSHEVVTKVLEVAESHLSGR